MPKRVINVSYNSWKRGTRFIKHALEDSPAESVDYMFSDSYVEDCEAARLLFRQLLNSKPLNL